MEDDDREEKDERDPEDLEGFHIDEFGPFTDEEWARRKAKRSRTYPPGKDGPRQRRDRDVL